MAPTEDKIEALLEMDRFVRLMAAAPGTSAIVAIVRAYLASWPEDRIVRLQASHSGWSPFDRYQQPFPLTGVGDVRQIHNSVRIRCRELQASDRTVDRELLELDLVLFFANESLDAHEPSHRKIADYGSTIEESRPRLTVAWSNSAAPLPASSMA